LIEDEMKKILNAADLGIMGVVFGDVQREGIVKPPLVGIFPAVSPIDDESLALHEMWKLRYVIIGIIKSLRPEQGARQAVQLALRASAEFIKTSAARQLNGLCSDVIRTGFIPAQDKVTNDGSVYGAGVEIEIRFWTKEA